MTKPKANPSRPIRTSVGNTSNTGHMLPALVSTLVVLVIGAITVALVVMGMEGRGQRRAPKLAGTMVRAARHLNGDPVRSRRQH